MACEKACVAEAVVGAAIAAIAVVSLFIKNSKLSVASSAVLLVGGVAAIAVPSFIGFCESEEMACRYITAPTRAILGSVIILLSAARFVTGVIALRRTADAV
jgi:drug/metabolite transporter (DMT)-like permease